jgi:Domain of unknown function (DUF4917)
MSVLTFEQALAGVEDSKTPHLLLGNGFSRACRNDIFAYEALFDRADFQALSPLARQAFDILQTRDFEVVMRALRDAASLLGIYQPESPEVVDRMKEDADGLREVLVRAIADNHPAWPGEIDGKRYAACRRFLARFKNIYTLNYDLLLYWALMNDDEPPAIPCDDGFRSPEERDEDYVTWEPGRHAQNIHYLHGALHVFDAGTEVQKYTWSKTGVRLIDQINGALNSGLYPIFVAEGESDQKFVRIRHSDFLAKAYRSFQEIQGTLFIYGHAMSLNDEHIIRLIGRGKVRQLFVGLYGDEDSAGNMAIKRRVDLLRANRPRTKPLEMAFFDSESANVWGSK